VPPPVQIGERDEPARARPVPFWRQGFAAPPGTVPRVLVAWVPWRRAASSARTDSCTSGSWNSAPKAASSSVTFFVPPRTGALAIGAHLYHAVARAGDGAADEQQVLGGPDVDDRDAALGDALVAHLAGQAHALEHARGRGARADRARRAHVVRAVALGAGLEPVALDRALEALALRGPGDLDLLAGLEGLDRDGLADQELARLVAELHDVLHGRRVGLAQVPELGLGEVLLLRRAEGELDGLVAVALVGADARHRAGPGLQDGDALDDAVVGEDLGHAELLGEDRGHLRQPDLDSHAGGQVVEELGRADRLRRALVDVDEPLVGPDLEVLLRVLVLERRADHGIDVLLGRQRHGTGDRRTRAGGGLNDLLGRRLDGRVVVRLEADPDLVLCGRGHWRGRGRATKPAPESFESLSPPPTE